MTSAFAPSLVDDARGVARLAIDGVLGVTDIVEHLHAAVALASPPLGAAAAAAAPGLAGFVYRRVRDVARGVGWGLDAALRPFGGALRFDLLEREHLRAAVNGVLGDRLHAAGNPLAIPMRLTAATEDRGSRIVVFAHGLCMHARHWPRGPGSMHAAALALGYAPVYLQYNSGRAIAANGAQFSRELDRLLATWPKRVTELAIVGHSMGGLVARRACAQAQAGAAPWLRRLRTLLFLGTPHGGSALERAGSKIDFALAMSPYSAPFLRLGGARSAGIQDLGADSRALPLPAGVHGVAVAGRLRGKSDGLVSLASALALDLPERQRVVIEGAGHLDLLRHGAAVSALERALASRETSRRERGLGARAQSRSLPVAAPGRPR